MTNADHASLSGDETLDLPEFDAPPSAPLPLAQRWLAEARERGVREPLSMTLATASADGVVSARTVDVKRIDDRGLVFGSSTESPKGRQLGENPHAALQVYWRETMQQLRFEGRIETLTDGESDALFADRSPKSRAATAVAHQSVPFAGASTLAELIEEADALLDRFGDDVPRPSGWVAYRVVPEAVEFWHGSRDRMHRRLRYVAVGDGWRAERLQP
ncbi:pyridoxal 5'-phosphate synthase [Microbacterium hatanonis]|jgi:pyridoxamine 5'-phosphate oxidase|uniref:Pyridoxamine 5'-phosphate oxidase n=1 Tax=Microbacterium hatanonis TaxID=404366 RepID=A0A5C8I2Z0_9MICO|nr:pyridoxal 5'-phosphate synthase [Microbacterium hatanonis]TXK12450.1 pyridoxamine 5'-phosphate oxidase [Microbacterium hatanonis]